MGLSARGVYPANDPDFIQFPSRRSVVHSTNGMIACTQPLAAEAGQRILKMGGNAAVNPYPLILFTEPH
jgi:gamma-glutamyltranspeptidase/glutathione hydrolase